LDIEGGGCCRFPYAIEKPEEAVRQSRRSSAADHGSADELDLRSILAGKVGGGRGIEWNRGGLGRRDGSAASGGWEEDRRRRRWMMARPAIGKGSAGEALDSTGLS
jgi:hypothetical protein